MCATWSIYHLLCITLMFYKHNHSACFSILCWVVLLLYVHLLLHRLSEYAPSVYLYKSYIYIYQMMEWFNKRYSNDEIQTFTSSDLYIPSLSRPFLYHIFSLTIFCMQCNAFFYCYYYNLASTSGTDFYDDDDRQRLKKITRPIPLQESLKCCKKKYGFIYSFSIRCLLMRQTPSPNHFSTSAIHYFRFDFSDNFLRFFLLFFVRSDYFFVCIWHKTFEEKKILLRKESISQRATAVFFCCLRSPRPVVCARYALTHTHKHTQKASFSSPRKLY